MAFRFSLLLLLAGTAAAQALIPPTHQFQIPALGGMQSGKRCGSASLWRMASERDGVVVQTSPGCSPMMPGGSSISAFALDGTLRWTIHVPPAGSVDFQPLASGNLLVFTLRQTAGRDWERTFEEITPGGAVVASRQETGPAGMFTILQDSLVTLRSDGTAGLTPLPLAPSKPTTVVPLGALVHNTLLLPLEGGRMTVVRQDSGDLETYDWATGQITSAHIQAPEIGGASRSYIGTTKAVMISDAAADQDGIYLLTMPYRPSNGALILKADTSGVVLGRWRCDFGGADAPVRMALVGGEVCLGSQSGRVGCFALR